MATEFPLFRQVTFWSVLGGLCPLIPIPLLDDWVLGRIERRMFRELGRAAGVAVSDEVAAILAGAGERSLPGCLEGCVWVLRSVVLKVVVKLYRKLLYFLAVRDGIHTSTEVFHRGYLWLLVLQGKEGAAVRVGRPPEPAEARRLRAAMVASLTEVEVKPIRRAVRRAFWGSLEAVVRGSRLLGRFFRRRRTEEAAEIPGEREVLEREEELLGGMIDRLAQTLWGNREHFDHLEAIFERHLAASVTARPDAP